jgi:hypothetical protein
MISKEVKKDILKKWNNLNFPKVTEQLMNLASEWNNGSIDAVITYNTTTKKINIFKESYNQWTKNMIYLYRLAGNDRIDVTFENLFHDLIEFDIDYYLEYY